MERPLVLLVDPDLPTRTELVPKLEAQGRRVETVDAGGAPGRLLRGDVDLVLAELNGASEALLAAAERQVAPPACVLLDSFGSADDALAALRRGADSVLTRPLPTEQVLLALERAEANRRESLENRRLREDLEQRFELASLVSRDPALKRIFSLVEAVADTRANLLLEGESGTGKTALARVVHQLSSRSAGPFVEVNCGALPKDLLESELFGHVRGAFTGAHRDREGKFEAAHGGTLFLDEVATASLELQVKLLRVLESRCFERVGDDTTRQVDVRVIAASNRNLAQEVNEGRFREDLYFRIQVVAIELPPLRARPLDIPLLAERFLARFRREYGRANLSLGQGALAALLAYDWPGNVRELEHALERAVLLAQGAVLEPQDLPAQVARHRVPTAPPGSAGIEVPLGPLKAALEGPERLIIQRALEATGGCRNQTARLLEINRTTLFNKMRKYGLLSFPSRAVPPGAPAPR